MHENLKPAYFSARNPFPIPIKCSISMVQPGLMAGWLHGRQNNGDLYRKINLLLCLSIITCF